jgi:hypothetical protein
MSSRSFRISFLLTAGLSELRALRGFCIGCSPRNVFEVGCVVVVVVSKVLILIDDRFF